MNGISTASSSKEWFRERLHADYAQSFTVEKVLFERDTGLQHLIIFENAFFGRVMALDGVIQLTERDEFFYHEMLAHVPLFAHGNAERVLIIGGGDGGVLREVLKHPCVRQVTMVEIDQAVVDMATQYFPAVSDGAFADARLELIIGDGDAFMQACDPGRYDVIITDSCDPVGPAEVLFASPYYAACKRCLRAEGILVTQNGVPFLQDDELRTTARRLQGVFADSGFYLVPVPTYIGSFMALGWGSMQPQHRTVALETLQARYAHSGITTRYYTPDIHCAAFALPGYIQDSIAKA